VRFLPRRLPSLLALVVVLASTLSATGLASAETRSQCVQRLNAVRAKAGLVQVRQSGTLTAAAQKHANYRAYADSHGLNDASAHYETSRRPYYSGARPWDRTRAAGLKDGTWARQGENVITGSGRSVSLQGVTAWLGAPYHRFPMLDANVRTIGCAASSDRVSTKRGAEVLEMVWPWSATQRKLTAYPVHGQTGVARSFDRRTEAPSPFRNARSAVVGSVVSLQASGWQAIRLVSTPTLKRGSSPVAVYSASPRTDSHLPDNAVMLAAVNPLAANTSYTATFRVQLQASPGGGWQTVTRTWSFRTA
jgi:uncharacterized protein YkwD